MPKYFCEYCGIYLTHSSPWGRKQHSRGRKHINNKIEYYAQFLYEYQQNTYNNLLNLARIGGSQQILKNPPLNPMMPMPQIQQIRQMHRPDNLSLHNIPNHQPNLMPLLNPGNINIPQNIHNINTQNLPINNANKN